jgi:hypothetical protein
MFTALCNILVTWLTALYHILATADYWAVGRAFVCGFVVDFLNVYYVASITGTSRVRTSLFSMLVGGFAITGIVEAAHTEPWWLSGLAIVLGYGAGSYVGQTFRQRP